MQLIKIFNYKSNYNYQMFTSIKIFIYQLLYIVEVICILQISNTFANIMPIQIKDYYPNNLMKWKK